MELIFKVDPKDNLNLLFCSSVSSDRKNSQSLNKPGKTVYNSDLFQIPKSINESKIPYKRGVNLDKYHKCMHCDELLDD